MVLGDLWRYLTTKEGALWTKTPQKNLKRNPYWWN